MWVGVSLYDPSASLKAIGKTLPAGQASFTNFSIKEGLDVLAPQTIFEDKQGRFWVGGGGGLYRYDGISRFYNVTKNGPWN